MLVNNLNALRHAGGQVVVAARVGAARMVVSVTDSGSGITAGAAEDLTVLQRRHARGSGLD